MQIFQVPALVSLPLGPISFPLFPLSFKNELKLRPFKAAAILHKARTGLLNNWSMSDEGFSLKK